MTAARDLGDLEAQASEAIMTCEWRAALPLLCRIILCAPRTFKNLPAAYAALAHVYVRIGRPATRRASSRARSSSRRISRRPSLCRKWCAKRWGSELDGPGLDGGVTSRRGPRSNGSHYDAPRDPERSSAAEHAGSH